MRVLGIAHMHIYLDVKKKKCLNGEVNSNFLGSNGIVCFT